MRNRDGNIVGLTLRVGRSIAGSARLAADLVEAGNSILLLGATQRHNISGISPECLREHAVTWWKRPKF